MTQTHFEKLLDGVTGRLVAMSRLVEALAETALESLNTRDIAKVRAVILGDREIDATEVEIEEECVELLARHQPMAGDLRRLVAIIKINGDLERVGDHAVNIVESAEQLIERGGDWTVPIELSEAAVIAQGMLRDALDSFVQHDAEKARAVLRRDDRVDRLHEALLRSMITVMMESPNRIGVALSLILISGNFERIADMATNISEEVVYFVEGKTIRHPRLLAR